MNPKKNKDLAPAHKRMSEVAYGLVRKFGAIDAAGVLIGAAVGVLEVDGSPAIAARYLREMADEIDGTPQRRAGRN